MKPVLQLSKLIEEKGKIIDFSPISIKDVKAGDLISLVMLNVEEKEKTLERFNKRNPEEVLKVTTDVFFEDDAYYINAEFSTESGNKVINCLPFPIDVFDDKGIFIETSNYEEDEEFYDMYDLDEELDDEFEEFEEVENTTISPTNFLPKKIEDHLNQFVVGQEDAKKKLSVEIFKHYCRMNGAKPNDLPKDNILLTGPTGCGKTYMLEILAKLINVPFAKCSCTSLTESGYVGDDVESVLQDLLKAAHGDLEKAQFGIVFLDEIDKIGRKGENPSITRDVSGEGVQTALLTMLGGTTMRVPLNGGSRKHPHADMVNFDTSNVLFIGAGCFEGVEEIIKAKKGTNKKTIGFASVVEEKKDIIAESNNLRKEITKDDLRKFGMIPELLGRFNVLANLIELDKEALVSICKLNNGEINKYKNLFEMFGKKLILSDTVFETLADRAIADSTGARGVKSALSELLVEYTYNIDDTSDVINVKVA